MVKRISIYDIAKAVSGTILNIEKWEDKILTGVSTDTRTISIDELFIPLKGNNFDGHYFIEEAYKKGAILSFTEDKSLIQDNQVAILVEDSMKALANFAQYYRSLFKIPVIAITGSVGKTSTKEMIASMLSTEYKVHKTSGNYNNEIGVPLTILKLEEKHEVAVIEMGMNHYGELHRLSKIVRPNMVVFTNIGVSHIEYFGSKEGILKAKEEILDFIDKDGLIILNGDDEYLKTIIGRYPNRIFTYGINVNNMCILKEYVSKEQNGQKAIIKTYNNIYEIDVKYIGKHILLNSMPGILISELLNISKHNIIKGITNYKSEKMRLNIYKLNNNITLIDDSYNASVDSMKSAIETLVSVSNNKGRTIAILGSMFEMGEYAEEGHKKVGEIVLNNKISKLICIGSEAKQIASGAITNGMNESDIYYYDNKEDFIPDIDSLIREDDTIIIKASRGMHLEKVVEQIRKSFS